MLQTITNHPLSKTLFIFLLMCIVIAIFATLLAPLLIPIIISFALYAVLEPISEIFERHGLSRNASSLSVLLILVALAALSISLLLPHLSTQLSSLQSQLPIVWQSIMSMGNEFSNSMASSLGLDFQSSGITEHFFSKADEWGKTALIEAPNILIGLSFLMILVPIFTFFLVRDYRTFRNHLLDMLPNSIFEQTWLIYHRVAHQLQEYIRGIMIQSGIMSVVTTIGFYAIGLDSPFLLGLIAGVLNLIPYVGPLLAMVLPVLLALGHIPVDLWLVGAAIMVIIFAQILDNVIVVPSVIANAVNLHPLVVIVGILVFGNLFGFIGMVVAIPVLSTANIIYFGLHQSIKTRHQLRQSSLQKNVSISS